MLIQRCRGLYYLRLQYKSSLVTKMFNAENLCRITITNNSLSLSKNYYSKSSSDCSNNYLEEMNRKSESISIKTTLSYEKAVEALNKLQSNAETVKQSINNFHNIQSTNLDETIKYLKRSGLDLNDLDKLSIIHVSGTKGKGSTCALTESILNSFGVKTGFFSSPHLISVTERFRINCVPISKEKFTKYFSKVYHRLNDAKEFDEDMPAYFKFLTILSFHLFAEESVDVVLLEVGIGGENDCTNIIRNTKTVGITPLGLEHTKLLGNTLEEIAWQKAGIIKQNSSVFTLQQPEECMKVIRERVKEKNAKLFVAPDFNLYKWTKTPKLQIQSNVQFLNASLAIQLSYDWLRKNKYRQLNGFSKFLKEDSIVLQTNDILKEGLEKCYWAGRCQTIKLNDFTIYLDGAHTTESIEICVDWFKRATNKSESPKVLIFNITGDRDSTTLMKYLMENINFKYACFVPNIPFDSTTKLSDTLSVLYTNKDQIKRSESYLKFWNSFNENLNNGRQFTNILDALKWINKNCNQNENIEILITGSLHLIGASILSLEEYDKCKEKFQSRNLK